MQVLTFTTGINDAVGYLGLDKVFTGNMTGNVVIFGMGLAGVDELPVLGPVLALVGFMAGAAVGGRALKRATGAWTTVTTALIAVVAVVMLGIAAVVWIRGDGFAGAWMYSVTTAAAAAMGLQAATARHIAVKDVTTVVVTSTITGLAADSMFGRGVGGGTSRRIFAVALMLAGACVGALLLKVHASAAFVTAGVLILAVAVIGGIGARSEQPSAA